MDSVRSKRKRGKGAVAEDDDLNVDSLVGGVDEDDMEAAANLYTAENNVGDEVPDPSKMDWQGRIDLVRKSKNTVKHLGKPRAIRRASIGGKWTAEEDDRLRAIVTEFGQVNNNSVGLAALTVATDTFERYGQGWTIWSVQLMNWLQTNGVPGYSKLPEAPPENWLRPFARTYAAAIAGEIVEQAFDIQSGFYALTFSADPDPSVRYLDSTIKCSPSVHYKEGMRSSIFPIAAGTMLQVSGRLGELIFRPNDSLRPNERVTINVWRVKD